MKIAISSSGNGIESALDDRFGRALKFIILDTDTDTCTVIDNTKNLEAAQGAGIQSAQNVIETGARVVITGHTGPKAFKLLNENGIKIYYAGRSTVKEAINAFREGKLSEAENADVESHW